MKRVCFSCGSEGHKKAEQVFWKEHPFEIRWCENCEVGWVVELPSLEILVGAYERLNYIDWSDKSPAALTKDIFRAYLKGYRVGDEFKSRRPGYRANEIRVLEIGSNIGAVLKGLCDSLKISVSQVVGVDFSKNHAEISEQRFGIRTYPNTLEEIAGKFQTKFDLIICHHIIEHDDDPMRFLQHLKTLLSPQGILSFELPNGLRELSYVERLNHGGIVPNTLLNHINFFSPRAFTRILKKAGFRPLSTSTMNARRVLRDFGWAPLNAPDFPKWGFQDIPNDSVISAFKPEIIEGAVEKSRRVAPFKHFTHKWLKLHFPDSIPWGRDIEAFVELSGKS